MNNKKETTMNELAEMMQREFGVVGDKMENMQGDMENMQGDMESMKGDIRSMKSEMDRKFEKVDDKFDQVLTGQDQILGRLTDLETDNTMDATAHRRREDKLENHEKRISVTEKKLGIGVMG